MFTMKFPALGSPLRMFRSAYSLIARHCVQIGVRTRTITTLFQDTQKAYPITHATATTTPTHKTAERYISTVLSQHKAA